MFMILILGAERKLFLNKRITAIPSHCGGLGPISGPGITYE